MTIRVSTEVLSKLDVAEDSFANRVNDALKRYEDELLPHLNGIHTWAFTPTNSLVDLLQEPFAAGNIKKVNELYWGDLFESIDAARAFFFKRSKPLVASSAELLNRGDLISAAPVARSLFELSIWALQHSATLKNTLQAYDSNANPNLHVMEATGLQELVFKLIWGTRLKERTKRNKQLSQMHIIDEFKKVAKRDELDFVEPTYDFLCELCHPNAVGNWLFANADGLDAAKSLVSVPISAAQSGAERDNALQHVCAAVSWAALAMVNSNSQFDEALIWIDKKFELAKLCH